MHHGQGERVTVPVFRDERQGRGDLETRETAELLWRILDELVEHAEQRCGVFQVVEDRTGEHLVHLVELVFQRRHHAEVATAASQTPEQVLVLACAGGEELSVRGDHIVGEEVVDGKSVCPRQVADTRRVAAGNDLSAKPLSFINYSLKLLTSSSVAQGETRRPPKN